MFVKDVCVGGQHDTTLNSVLGYAFDTLHPTNLNPDYWRKCIKVTRLQGAK